MEINRAYKFTYIRLLILMALIIWAVLPVRAQFQHAKCEFKNGEFYIELDKNIKPNTLDSFITSFDLADLDLKKVLRSSNPDTLKKLGWNIRVNNNQKIIITRPLLGSSNINDPVEAIINAEKHANFAELFPVVDERVNYGYNRFKNKYPFAEHGQVVRFYLRNNLAANRIMLAGSFNDWLPDNLPMTKTDSGWIADVKLVPGKYWYKFIRDGNWMTDADNLLKENDGLGNINSVFFKSNVVFKLAGHANAKKIFVAGSFNNWRPNELQMNRVPNGWELPVYLADGTHTYKFVADRDWLPDPANNNRLPDGEGGFNSVLTLGTPYKFKLEGYGSAKNVFLAGSFNNWRKDELQMTKKGNGWELPYVLRPGNYEYRFVIDGKEITDPANSLRVTSPMNTVNSFLIIDPNYTFRLKMPGAKSVYLAGDFNNWSPNSLAMRKVGDEWVYPVHLAPGKHKYKFIVDGNWITDPANKQWEQNEQGSGNSVIWVDRGKGGM